MNLQDKLIEDNILLPIKAENRKDAVKELLSQLQAIGILAATSELFSTINDKENIFTSAAGRGIAYPHSTSKEVDKLVCILGISETGINFDSPDGQLCHLILLTLSPEDDPSEHRKFITRFRIMFDDPETRSSLFVANQSRQVIEIIQKWEERESNNDGLE